jgi:serine/threonine protein kinase
MPQSNEIALTIGSELQEYRIEGVLGVGGFGITYLAIDKHLDKKVVIKEFLPNDIAVRKDGDTVVAKSHSDKDNFEWGMSRFLQEAKTLAKFNHPNIVKINRFFQANNTAYFVMDYEEGKDLQEYIGNNNKIFSEEEIYNIIMPILDGLREVHSHDFLHRDIKPGNIFIRKNGTPMLIDFGASRFAMGAKSKSLSVVLTEGYAPKEQYSSTSKQGPYTDIYAIGAVMYKMATGKTPVEASARVDATSDDEPDPYVKLQEQNIPYSDNFKKAVDSSLELSAKNRPQSVRELQDILMDVKKEKTTIEHKVNESFTNNEENERKQNFNYIDIFKMSVFVLIGGLLVTLVNGLSRWYQLILLRYGVYEGLIHFILSISFLFALKSMLNLKRIWTLALFVALGAFFGDIIRDVIALIFKEVGLKNIYRWGIGYFVFYYFLSVGILYAFKEYLKINIKTIVKLSVIIGVGAFISDVLTDLIRLLPSSFKDILYWGPTAVIDKIFILLGFLIVFKKFLAFDNRYILKVLSIFSVLITIAIFCIRLIPNPSIGYFSFALALYYYAIGLALLISVKLYKNSSTKQEEENATK